MSSSDGGLGIGSTLTGGIQDIAAILPLQLLSVAASGGDGYGGRPGPQPETYHVRLS